MKIPVVDWNFIAISAILGLKYQTYFIWSIFGDFFSRGQLPGAENPRCTSQNPNLTNKPHSVHERTFICAIGHQKRIIIREDSLSLFLQVKKRYNE